MKRTSRTAMGLAEAPAGPASGTVGPEAGPGENRNFPFSISRPPRAIYCGPSVSANAIRTGLRPSASSTTVRG